MAKEAVLKEVTLETGFYTLDKLSKDHFEGKPVVGLKVASLGNRGYFMHCCAEVMEGEVLDFREHFRGRIVETSFVDPSHSGEMNMRTPDLNLTMIPAGIQFQVIGKVTIVLESVY